MSRRAQRDDDVDRHDEACYRMLWLKHSVRCPDDELERAYDSICAEWACDPLRHDDDDDDRVRADARRIASFCRSTVR
jgi:hypothetical protein